MTPNLELQRRLQENPLKPALEGLGITPRAPHVADPVAGCQNRHAGGGEGQGVEGSPYG